MGQWEDEKPLLQTEDGEKKHLLTGKATKTKFTATEKRNIAFFIAGMLHSQLLLLHQHLITLINITKELCVSSLVLRAWVWL